MTATLPTVARQAAHALGETLAARRALLAREEAAELVQVAHIIGASFVLFLEAINEGLAEGVSSRSLRTKLAEGITAAEETIQEFTRLEKSLSEGPHSPRLAEALRKSRGEVERIRGELAAILDFANHPPAVPSFAELAEAAKGPFVPLRK